MGTAFQYSKSWPDPVSGQHTEHGVPLDAVYTGNLIPEDDGKTVTVLEGATFEGEVGAERIVIHGIVRGIIKADSIIISKSARVEGEIRYGTLTIEPGAEVDARCIPA